MADNAEVQARISREMAKVEYQLATLRSIFHVAQKGNLDKRTMSSLMAWLKDASEPIQYEKAQLLQMQSELTRSDSRQIKLKVVGDPLIGYHGEEVT